MFKFRLSFRQLVLISFATQNKDTNRKICDDEIKNLHYSVKFTSWEIVVEELLKKICVTDNYYVNEYITRIFSLRGPFLKNVAQTFWRKIYNMHKMHSRRRSTSRRKNLF